MSKMFKISYSLKCLVKTIIGIAIYISLFTTGSLGATASVEKVTISIVHKGADDYFIAKRGSSILWKYSSWGSILHDKQSGISVLESSQLLVVDRFGTIRKRLDFNAAHSPRSIFLDRGCLVYDTGDLAIAAYNPSAEGAHLAAWLSEVRHVCVFNVRTYHSLWEAPESDVGLPIACNHGHLDTLRITNITKCLERHEVTPIVAITEINVTNKHQTRNAVLNVTRREALNLMDAFLGVECVTPVILRWSKIGIHAVGLFGQSYTGKL